MLRALLDLLYGATYQPASKGTYAMIDDEILSKVTSIEEDEEDCEDTDEIED